MEIEKFDDTIDIWIKALSGYSYDQLLIKPNETSWSLGQLYLHIINESEWYNSQMEIALIDLNHRDKPMTLEAQQLFDRGEFEDRRIVGDQTIAQSITQPESIDQLLRDLHTLKKASHDLWLKIQQDQNHGKSQHPGLGYFTALQWILFSEMHLRHHLKQKQRLDHFLDNHMSN
mgnify:FL=1